MCARRRAASALSASPPHQAYSHAVYREIRSQSQMARVSESAVDKRSQTGGQYPHVRSAALAGGIRARGGDALQAGYKTAAEQELSCPSCSWESSLKWSGPQS